MSEVGMQDAEEREEEREMGHQGTGCGPALLRRGTDRKGGREQRAYGRDRVYREEVALNTSNEMKE